MEEQKSNSNLKAIVVVLALLLVGSLAYIFKLSSDAKATQEQIVKVTDDKGKVLDELTALKATYDDAIAENTSMSSELITEREKVVQLMNDVQKSKGDVASLQGYRQKFIALDSKMKTLMVQVDELKAQNATLTVQRDSTVTVLGESKKYNEVLVGQNEELSKTVERGSKLTITNLQTAAYKLKSSGKEVATEKASRADVLKISFTVAENSIAKSCDTCIVLFSYFTIVTKL